MDLINHRNNIMTALEEVQAERKRITEEICTKALRTIISAKRKKLEESQEMIIAKSKKGK